MRPTRRFSTLLFWFTRFVAFCFFLALQAAAAPQQLAPQWNVAAHALGEKIAAAAGSAGAVAVNMTNSSSLSSSDASAIYDGLLIDLRARHLQIVSPVPQASAGVRVQVTLAENQSHYVLVAQIWVAADADEQIGIVSLPKLPDHAAANLPSTVVLSRRLIYAQAGKILDFALLEVRGSIAPSRNLVVLEPDRVAFFAAVAPDQWQPIDSRPVSHAGAWPRDLSGTIDPVTGKVALGGAACDGDLFHPDALDCKISRVLKPWAASASNRLQPQVPDQPEDGALLAAACPQGPPILLGSGDGDWTRADHLQAFEVTAQGSRPLGQPFQLSGPVLSLGSTADGKEARVVSLNLQTGNYEASIVSASCGN